MSGPVLLEIEHLTRDFILPRPRPFAPHGHVRAVADVSLAIDEGESLGLIGESGSGKSTLARLVLALDQPSSGTVRLGGEDVFTADRSALRRLRKRMQIVFQDPYGSLDPRRTVGWSTAEPLAALEPGLPRSAREARAADALESVGLSSSLSSRYPHEFSGGQRQRIAIARALVTNPDLIVADEPVSALDVSVQAQILNLLTDLQKRRGITFLFISHDLNVVRHIAGRVAVMYRGRIVEAGPTEEVYAHPAHPYTALLLSAAPRPNPSRRRRSGHRVPEPLDFKEVGCAFASRCPRAQARCRAEAPALAARGNGRLAACFFPLD